MKKKTKTIRKISDLKPRLIWKFFEDILQIPRASKKEEKILAYIENFAIKNKLDWKRDKIGNYLINKPAFKGYENRHTVVLQSHVDMVCEKNESSHHNFTKDPIKAYISGGWVKAEGTTLGADNGIGVAAQMAILADKNLEHGPISCLFTVDEESGLTGAFNLGEDLINGDILINLDSEDEGELFIGCAGGMDTIITFPYTTKHIKDDCVAFHIKIKGLTGGHSGDDINKGRGNANKILARILWNVTQKFKTGLFEFEGGNLRNAIPRESRASLLIKKSKRKEFIVFLKGFIELLKTEFFKNEPHLLIDYSEVPLPRMVMTGKSAKKLINTLHSCPNGVVEMSQDISGLVKTSSNLASVKMLGENKIEIVTSQRSSVETMKQNVSDRINSLFQLAKCRIIQTGSYPGWSPNTNSLILKITEQCYKDLFGKPPRVKAIHAGLECGLFLKKYPNLDMISFGPTIKGAHSPDERLDIDSVRKFWDLLLGTLKSIPTK